MPPGFTWIDSPHLAAHAYPDAEDLVSLRRSGIDVLVTLTEEPLPRHWVNNAGMMAVHLPVPDMEAPTPRQLNLAIETIERAKRSGMAVAVHCQAGRGRTGTVLAAYFVSRGMEAQEAIRKVRGLRPGSLETREQERAVEDYAEGKGGER